MLQEKPLSQNLLKAVSNHTLHISHQDLPKAHFHQVRVHIPVVQDNNLIKVSNHIKVPQDHISSNLLANSQLMDTKHLLAQINQVALVSKTQLEAPASEISTAQSKASSNPMDNSHMQIQECNLNKILEWDKWN